MLREDLQPAPHVRLERATEIIRLWRAEGEKFPPPRRLLVLPLQPQTARAGHGRAIGEGLAARPATTGVRPPTDHAAWIGKFEPILSHGPGRRSRGFQTHPAIVHQRREPA